MTVVTTSRKPVPEVRSLARDLAFATGAEYVTRGKAGMADILDRARSVLIVSKSGRFFCIDLFSDGEPVTRITVRSFVVDERRGRTAARGLYVADDPVYRALKDHINVVFAGETLPEHQMVFDGTQRKRYSLEVAL